MKIEFVADRTDNESILARVRLVARSGIFANLAIESYRIVRGVGSMHLECPVHRAGRYGRLFENEYLAHRRADANDCERLAAINAFELRIIEAFARCLVGHAATGGAMRVDAVVKAARVRDVTAERGGNPKTGALFAIELTMDYRGQRAVSDALDTDIFARLRPKPAPDTRVVRAKRRRGGK